MRNTKRLMGLSAAILGLSLLARASAQSDVCNHPMPPPPPGAPASSPTPATTPTPTPLPGGGGAATPGGLRGGSTPAPRGTTGGSGSAGGAAATPAPKKVAGGAGRWVPRGGTTPRSPHVCDVVLVNWIDAGWPLSINEGYGASPLPLSALISRRCTDPACVNLKCKHPRPKDAASAADRLPAMVYLYDPTEKREAKTKRDVEIFGADATSGLFAFVSPFSMAADAVERAEYEKSFGKRLPALVFLSPAGRTIGVLEGTFAAADVRAMIEKTLAETWGVDGKAHAQKYQDTLKEIERAEDDYANAARREREVADQIGKATDDQARAKLAEAAAKKADALANYRKFEIARLDLLQPKPGAAPVFAPKAKAAAKN